jgi:hypothetical protein
MRCGHCGRKLTAAALALGYCPHCGSLLRSDDEGPMRRMGVHEDRQDPALPAPSQAALPPPDAYAAQAMPPGRTSLPQHPSVMSFPDAMQSPTTPPSSMNGRTSVPQPSAHPPPQYSQGYTSQGYTSTPGYGASSATPGGPGAQPGPMVEAAPPPVMPPPLPPQPNRRSSTPAIIGTVLVLVAVTFGALFIAGGNGVGPFAHAAHTATTTSAASTATPGITPVATATSAPVATDTPVPPTATPLPAVPTAPAGFTTYNSTDGVFGLNYPTSWTTSTTPPNNGITGFNFVSPLSSSEAATVDESDTAIDPTNIAVYVRNFANSSNGTNVQITQAPATQTIGKNDWTVAQATYTANDGEHKVIGLAINDGTTGLIFFYDAPSSSFHTDSGSSYDVMVKSFTILH